MMQQGSSPAILGRVIRQLLITGIIIALLYWLGSEAWAYWRTYTLLPPGTMIGGVDVSGQTRDEAIADVEQAYMKPVLAQMEDEVIEISPLDTGFTVEAHEMVDTAIAEHEESPHWQKFARHLTGQSLLQTGISIPVRAGHNPDDVRVLVNLLGEMIDRPAQAPLLLTDGDTVEAGQPGYVLNRLEAEEAITSALYEPYERVASLTIADQPVPELDFSYVENRLRQDLETFNGIGSLYVLDLQSNEEININSDVAVSGLSIVKIAIMLEMLRAVDNQLDFDQQKLLEETAVFSGNYSANLLLDVVAGQNNAYLGVDVLTESMQALGLDSTFIVTPYEEPPRGGKQTLRTPANSRQDINLDPDPAMQTTAAEMGQLLAMIYYCSQGGGALIAAYPEQLTPNECQYLIDLMAENDEGNLIRFGVPEDVKVSHKHGWAFNTHGDAGIVFSPGGDYIIVQYLYQDSDWMPANISFPFLREQSRMVYNYFNPDAPYADHKRAQRVAGKAAALAAARAAEAADSEP